MQMRNGFFLHLDDSGNHITDGNDTNYFSVNCDRKMPDSFFTHLFHAVINSICGRNSNNVWRHNFADHCITGGSVDQYNFACVIPF